jgi:hypothetical protein
MPDVDKNSCPFEFWEEATFTSASSSEVVVDLKKLTHLSLMLDSLFKERGVIISTKENWFLWKKLFLKQKEIVNYKYPSTYLKTFLGIPIEVFDTKEQVLCKKFELLMKKFSVFILEKDGITKFDPQIEPLKPIQFLKEDINEALTGPIRELLRDMGIKGP